MSTGSLNAEKHGITQHFGEDFKDSDGQWHYKKYGLKGHPGLDLGDPSGSAVYCEEGGIVTNIVKNDPYAGTFTAIRTKRKTPTVGEWRYLHLSRTKVKIGQRVHRGDVIGYSGNTGDSTAPHLHIEYKPFIPYTSFALYPVNGYGGRRDPLRRLLKYRKGK